MIGNELEPPDPPDPPDRLDPIRRFTAAIVEATASASDDLDLMEVQPSYLAMAEAPSSSIPTIKPPRQSHDPLHPRYNKPPRLRPGTLPLEERAAKFYARRNRNAAKIEKFHGDPTKDSILVLKATETAMQDWPALIATTQKSIPPRNGVSLKAHVQHVAAKLQHFKRLHRFESANREVRFARKRFTASFFHEALTGGQTDRTMTIVV
ncbi:hypothetical protein HDU97_008632 [Phlyctochytrium planicorne]|nr:hypothetical protein HDU97_008632 [Phlyctochytrium planicorne]